MTNSVEHVYQPYPRLAMDRANPIPSPSQDTAAKWKYRVQDNMDAVLYDIIWMRQHSEYVKQ
jgi:hypothetical protein